MNAVHLNGVLNGVHRLLNAELNASFFPELNAELNADLKNSERLLNAAFSIQCQYFQNFQSLNYTYTYNFPVYFSALALISDKIDQKAFFF